MPVLLGLPWLAGVLGGLFASVFSYFAQYLTKRIALVVTVIAVLVTLTASMFTALQAIITGLSYAVPASISEGMALLIPDNALPCLTAVISAHVIRYVYDWNVRILQYKLF